MVEAGARTWLMSEFQLHPRLEADTALVADWSLSRVLLMNDTRYTWLILVPRKVGLTEIHDLSVADRALLIEEIVRASEKLKAFSKAAKINVGALGNLVPQLHVHVVARRPDDFAWPGPVWGQGVAQSHETHARDTLVARLRAAL
jgi:diadenosine tetraphosphate (Ap4A) HIT family hydrolase